MSYLRFRSGNDMYTWQSSRYLLLAIIVWSSASRGAQVQDPPEFRSLRKAMIDRQILPRGVKDPRVLKAMEDIPRHLFVDESLWPVAYSDGPLPIGHGQTISQPYIVSLMTELLQADTHHVVLEIGAGSGYQAAILSNLVHHVFTIEIIEELGLEAEKRLKRLGYDNITVRVGDGYQGWPEEAPFDRIIVTAAPQEIPPKLVEQLKPGGRMVLPVGPQWWGQDLIIIEKDEKGNISKSDSIPVRFVPMVHEPED
ncbi:MAG: protein-L-isoaspartate(D-aspartate) O-methyltransferase [Candidatus Neomarinimicrobiota bacterium]